MEKDLFANAPLFQGFEPGEREKILNCLQGKSRTYEKDELILRAGDVVSALGMVLSGSVLIENDDVWGDRRVLDKAGLGQIFAETYACVPGERLMVNVRAAENTQVLFLDIRKVLSLCPRLCSFHHQLIRNLLMISSQKNLTLSRRIFNTSSKTIRGRLLSYLSYEALKHGSREFSIPFNRQQLADYLGVDRSALSAELGKMQRDGLIQVKRKDFWLIGGEFPVS